jgi:hypothetical protein
MHWKLNFALFVKLTYKDISVCIKKRWGYVVFYLQIY